MYWLQTGVALLCACLMHVALHMVYGALLLHVHTRRGTSKAVDVYCACIVQTVAVCTVQSDTAAKQP